VDARLSLRRISVLLLFLSEGHRLASATLWRLRFHTSRDVALVLYIQWFVMLPMRCVSVIIATGEACRRLIQQHESGSASLSLAGSWRRERPAELVHVRLERLGVLLAGRGNPTRPSAST